MGVPEKKPIIPKIIEPIIRDKRIAFMNKSSF